MTWNELNVLTGYSIEDYMGSYDSQEFLDESGDEQLWGCDALTGIIECLEVEYDDMPMNYDAELLDNARLRKVLAAVR